MEKERFRPKAECFQSLLPFEGNCLMKTKLLVDSDEFWPELKSDVLSAKNRVFLQTLSFEGDRVGQMLSALLLSLTSVDVRIIVDCFTKWMLNDKFLYAPKNLLNPQLRQEAGETAKMIKNLREGGVGVKFTNPMGWIPTRLAARNHKKLIIIDNRIAYIGGINFSEHNFTWHDMMVKMEDDNIAEFLSADFLSTWKGYNSTTYQCFEEIELQTFDGNSNETAFEKILNLIDGAKEEIFVESPYLTFPVFDSLKEAKARGVAVTIVTPETNNWKFMKEYLLWEATRAGIEIRLYPTMTHLKAMLVDNTHLVTGSYNFDYLGYRLHQEVIAIIADRRVISKFRDRVIQPDLKNSRKFEGKVNWLKGQTLNLALRSLGWSLAAIN